MPLNRYHGNHLETFFKFNFKFKVQINDSHMSLKGVSVSTSTQDSQMSLKGVQHRF